MKALWLRLIERFFRRFNALYFDNFHKAKLCHELRALLSIQTICRDEMKEKFFWKIMKFAFPSIFAPLAECKLFQTRNRWRNVG